MSGSEGESVEIYHRANRLKLKAGQGLNDGEGYIDPHAVKRAHTIIEKHSPRYKREIEDILNKISDAWEDLKSARDSGEKTKAIESLYHSANHVTDLASTFGYALMQHFGESLRTFAEKIDPASEAHHAIVQAHIDVMSVAYHENIRDHGGAQAEELKLIVGRAIKKYS